jgi:hypothetical protein
MDNMTRRGFLASSSVAALAAAGTAASAAAIKPRTDVSAVAASGALEVGVARRDVTPPLGIQMWGYSNPEQLANGVRDPLYCRCVVMKAGDTALGIVHLDMGRMLMPGQCARLRESARAAGIADVIFCATHTHSGPIMELPDLPHPPMIAAAALDGLKEALNNAEPATLNLGRTTIDISHNRRLIKDGVCWMRWRNAERVPTSPVDHEAGLLRLDSKKTGKPIVTLVHYACHPVIFGSDNRRYSADWPGEMAKGVAAATGGECIFLQGGAGDINPYLDKTPIAEGAEKDVVGEGKKAAEAVIAALAGMKPVPGGALAYREEPVAVGTRWDLSDPSQTKILESSYGVIYEKYMKGLSPDFAVPLGTLLLNDRVVLSFMPGELFVDFQLDLKRRSPLPDTFLCGYSNEFHIYFPTVRDITYGGYGAATVTYVGVGAGERLVTRATEMLGEMTGKIHPLRGPGDFKILEV